MNKRLIFAVVAIATMISSGFTTLPAHAAYPPCTITVTTSGETVTGTSNGDVICLQADNLIVNALGGDDIVIDDGLNNTVYLGEGLDIYDGTLGEDGTVDGGTGNDTITGTPGEDELTGGDGDDTIIGGDANDTLNGGLGADELTGSAGEDILNGEAGEDELDGGDDPDTLNGGPEADILIGGSGNDTMNGGIGNDELAGGIGDDSLFGEAGADTLRGEEGNDIVAGGADIDSINGGAGLNDCDFTSGEQTSTTCRYDDAAPSVLEVSWEPQIVEVGSSSATTTFQLAVSDSTGIDTATLYCSLGNRTFWVSSNYRSWNNTWRTSFYNGTTTTSEQVLPVVDRKSFSFTQQITIPFGFTPGTYNCYSYSKDSLGNEGYNWNVTSLTVTRFGESFDDAAPSVLEVSWEPQIVEVGSSSATTTFQLAVSDSTGIDTATLYCSLGNRTFWVSSNYRSWNNTWRTSFYNGTTTTSEQVLPVVDRKSFSFTQQITIPFGFTPGTYNCYSYSKDSLGNEGYNWNVTSLTVTRFGESFDDAAPSVLEVSWEPQIVEVGSSSATTTFQLAVSDSTGIDTATLYCSLGNRTFWVSSNYRSWNNTWRTSFYNGTTTTSEQVLPVVDRKSFSFTQQITIPFGFTPGTYNCYSYSKDSLGNEGYNWNVTSLTVFRTPAGQPSTPTSVSYIPTNPTSGTLSWSPPVELGSPSMHAYVVEISEDGTTWNRLTGGATTGTSLDISNLSEGTRYWLRVRGENGGTVGQDTRFMSLNWGVVEFATPQATAPDAPTNLVVSERSSDSFRLAWTAPTYSGGRDINNFTVEVSTDNGTTWRSAKPNASTSLSYTVSGASPATRYLVRVAAVNIIGASEYLTGEVRTLATVPTAPRTLTAGSVASNSLTLSWQLPSSNGGAAITDYKVEFSANNGSTWTEITHTPSNNLAFNVTSLRSNQAYRFRVSAINEGGVGAASNIVSVNTLVGPPQEPTNLTSTRATATGASLAWVAPTNTGGSRLTDYLVQLSRDGGSTWTTVTKRASTSLTLSLTGLAAATTYQVRVAAVNARGAGATATTSFTTLAGPPSAPTNLRSSDVTGTTATIAWDLPPSNGGSAITNYRVEVSSNCRTYTVLPRTVSNSLAQNVTNLLPGVAYCFRVSTITAIGTSPVSSVLTVTTVGNPPNAPTSLAVRASATQVTLSWRAATVTGGGPVRNYIVEYSRDGGATWINVNKSVSTSVSLAIRNLTRSTAYLFRVYAVNDSGTSPVSANLAVTTPAR